MSEATLPSFAKPVRFRTKQELVYRTLRDAIMRCELPPGRRLVIDELARQLEVSAIPVREALHILQSEGLVVNVPHVGATVSPISREATVEVFSLMEGLEIVATRTAAQRMTREDAEDLSLILGQMDDALAAARHHDWADLNTRFHLTISKVAAMPMLLNMTERVMSRWDRLRRYYFNGVLVHRVEQAQEEHRVLLRAMRDKDLPGLERIVKLHNQGALLAYSEYQKGHPE